VSFKQQLTNTATKDAMHKMVDALGDDDRAVMLTYRDTDGAGEMYGAVFPHDLRAIEAAGLLSLGTTRMHAVGDKG
jgi:hypothetical protein